MSKKGVLVAIIGSYPAVIRLDCMPENGQAISITDNMFVDGFSFSGMIVTFISKRGEVEYPKGSKKMIPSFNVSAD